MIYPKISEDIVAGKKEKKMLDVLTRAGQCRQLKKIYNKRQNKNL